MTDAILKTRQMKDIHHLPRYVQVRHVIEQGISEKRFGGSDPLPPERDLALKFGVSRATLRKALTELEKRRILHRIQGKGTFVVPKRERVRGRLVAVSFFDGSHRSPTFSGASIVLRDHNRFPIVVAQEMERVDAEAEMVAQIVDQDVAGLLLTPTFPMHGEHRDNSDLYRDIVQLGIPVVTMDRILPEYKVSAVTHDHLADQSIAVEWLASREVKRVGYLGLDRGYLGKRKAKSMDEAARKAGLDWDAPRDSRLCDDLTAFPDRFSETAGLDLLEKCPDLEALLCYSDRGADALFKAIRQKELKHNLKYLIVESTKGYVALTEDVVSGIDVRVLVNDRVNVGLQAAELLMEQIYHGTPQEPVVKQLKPQFVSLGEALEFQEKHVIL